MARSQPAGGRLIVLTELRVTNFRCFESLRFRPNPGINFLVGANAQGKTSILEAICVATRLQSPRTSTLADVVRANQPACALAASVHDQLLQLRFTPPQRRLMVDGVEVSRSSDYLGVARVAWFSNDDLEMVRGPSAKRRRYLDFLCSQIEPNYTRNLRAYEKALRSRNSLLKENRPRREIEAFDAPLTQAGDAVTATRRSVLDQLAPEISRAVHEIGDCADRVIAEFQASAPDGLCAALRQSLAQESRLRQTVVGAHRDDFLLTLNELEAAKFASEGQQRSLAVSLRLAQARLMMASHLPAPIFLIDDVFGELDLTRRRNLLANLPSDSQLLITTTHLDWLDPDLPHTRFGVKNFQIDCPPHP